LVCSPGAQLSLDCAPGSTNKQYLCSREHKSVTDVLPGAQSSDIRGAPGSTDTAYLCSREHKYCLHVLPAAQIWLDCVPGRDTRGHLSPLLVLPAAQTLLACAPGSTNTACLCARKHKYCQCVLPGAQILLSQRTQENTL
jgi:hypothetical protein